MEIRSIDNIFLFWDTGYRHVTVLSCEPQMHVPILPIYYNIFIIRVMDVTRVTGWRINNILLEGHSQNKISTIHYVLDWPKIDFSATVIYKTNNAVNIESNTFIKTSLKLYSKIVKNNNVFVLFFNFWFLTIDNRRLRNSYLLKSLKFKYNKCLGVIHLFAGQPF